MKPNPMHRLLALFCFALALMTLAIACGPSKSDCEELCSWADQVCTDNSECVADCRAASREDVEYAMDNCIDREVSSCQSANCCLRFTYTEYYFQQNCL